MQPEMPRLAFLPLERTLIHERHDDQRTLPLIHRIRTSGVFRNPPVVAPFLDGSLRHMVLDGANRITALREMGIPHALVQVVEPGDPGLRLQNWSHIVWELGPERFLEGLRAVPGLQLKPLEDRETTPDLVSDCGLAHVQLPGGEIFSLCCTGRRLEERVACLNAVVDSYRERARLDRANTASILPLAHIYPNLSGMVVFPNFILPDVMRLAGAGYLLPSGITRFTISPRVLHLNYPLEELQSSQPLDEKNERLQRWIHDRLAHKGVRYYAEATILFDE